MCNETEKQGRWKRYRYFHCIHRLLYRCKSPSPQRTDSAFYPWETSAPSCQPARVNRCCVSVPKPPGAKAWGAPGCVLRGGIEERCCPREGAVGQMCTGVSKVMGDIGSGTILCPLPAPAPALRQPPRGSVPELGGWESRMRPECRTRLPHTHFVTREMMWGGTQGVLLVVSVRGKERAGGFKNKCICSALLKIEKVALNSSPTKGLKVKQAPNRERLSAK